MWLILSSPEAGFISGLFVCPGLEDSWQPPIYLWWTSISLCRAGRQRGEHLTSSAGWGRGWAIVMNIMCKYERRETKGRFCYGNAVIGADWVVIRRRVHIHTCECMCMRSCMPAGNKTLWFLLSVLLPKNNYCDTAHQSCISKSWVLSYLNYVSKNWQVILLISFFVMKTTACIWIRTRQLKHLIFCLTIVKQQNNRDIRISTRGGFIKSFNLSFITIS